MRLILSAALAASVPTAAMAQTIDAGEIVALGTWSYDDLYAAGWSVEELIDMDVVDATGEDVGDIEDVIFGADGKVLSVVAEIGGFLDIGDTHVSIPWEEITVQADNVLIPITEENIDQYQGFELSVLPASEVGQQIVAGVDDVPTDLRAWRATELIGDYARVRGEADELARYGYVNDIIVRDGEIAATVIDPGVGYGRGYFGYPYYGYRYGWRPGAPYYDMPYTVEEVRGAQPLEYERFD